MLVQELNVLYLHQDSLLHCYSQKILGLPLNAPRQPFKQSALTDDTVV